MFSCSGVSVFRLGIQQKTVVQTTNIYYYIMRFSTVLATISNAIKGTIILKIGTVSLLNVHKI